MEYLKTKCAICNKEGICSARSSIEAVFAGEPLDHRKLNMDSSMKHKDISICKSHGAKLKKVFWDKLGGR